MEYTDKYIPKELLALKINYCRKRLSQLPKFNMHTHSVRGIQTVRMISSEHRYNLNSERGQAMYAAAVEREKLERQLEVYEAIWNCYYRMPPPEYDPPKVVKRLRTDYNRQVILNKEYFDALKNDANTMYPKPMLHPFNGIQYRSAAEKEIAMFYTEMGIPFKYEPEVRFPGVKKPQFPDFVLYITELDTCKFHEHFGLMNYASYNRDIKLKCTTFADAGLLIDQDVFFTYNTEDQPLDTRYLAAKINTAVYGTLINYNEWINCTSI